MKYKANKTFERGGAMYRAGDDLPEGLDEVTIAHYLRHGMIVSVMSEEDAKRLKSAETKPIKQTQSRTMEPTEKKDLPPDPPVTGTAGNQVTTTVAETGGDSAGASANQGE